MALTPTQILASKVSEALQQGDRRGFVRAVTALIDARAPMVQGWKALTKPLLDYGELELARRSIALYCTAMKNAPTAQFEAALILTQTARPIEALHILDKIGPAQPDLSSNAYLRGTIALNLGNREVAVEALLRAHRSAPGTGQILQTLSMTGSMAVDAISANAILDAASPMATAPAADRAAYFFGNVVPY